MRAIVIATMLVLAGCATSGVEITDAKMATIEKGRTTYAELVAQLGAPTTSTVAEDGTRTAIYGFAKGNSAALVPVVGLFTDGFKVEATRTTFTFDQAGVLRDYSTTKTSG